MCTVPWETSVCPPLSKCAAKLTYHPFKQTGFSANNREKQPSIPLRVAFVFIVLTLPFNLLKNTPKEKKKSFQHALLNSLWMLSTKELPSSERQKSVYYFLHAVVSLQVSGDSHLVKVPHKFKPATRARELSIWLPTR